MSVIPYTNSGSLIRSGFMVKQGGRRKSWKKRFFVLRDGLLTYHKGPDTAELGRLNLADYKMTRHGDTISKFKYIFILENPNFNKGTVKGKKQQANTQKRGAYYISCQDEEDLEDWMSAIQGVIDRAKQQQQHEEGLNIPNEISDDGSTVFGLPLVLFCERSNSTISEGPLPRFLSECFSFLEKFLDTEGIFRVAGSAAAIKQLKAALNSRNWDKFTIPPAFDSDPFSIAAFVKLYFRSLPDPLLASDNYHSLIQIAQSNEENPDENMKIRKIRGIIDSLPRPHKFTLDKFVSLLIKVESHKEHNLMTFDNIATVIIQSLFRPQDQTFHSIAKDTGYQVDIVKTILTNHIAIFNAPEKDGLYSLVATDASSSGINIHNLPPAPEIANSDSDVSDSSDDDEEYHAPLPSPTSAGDTASPTATESSTPKTEYQPDQNGSTKHPSAPVPSKVENENTPTNLKSQPNIINRKLSKLQTQADSSRQRSTSWASEESSIPVFNPRKPEPTGEIVSMKRYLDIFLTTRGVEARGGLERLLTQLINTISTVQQDLSVEKQYSHHLEQYIISLESQISGNPKPSPSGTSFHPPQSSTSKFKSSTNEDEEEW